MIVTIPSFANDGSRLVDGKRLDEDNERLMVCSNHKKHRMRELERNMLFVGDSRPEPGGSKLEQSSKREAGKMRRTNNHQPPIFLAEPGEW